MVKSLSRSLSLTLFALGLTLTGCNPLARHETVTLESTPSSAQQSSPAVSSTANPTANPTANSTVSPTAAPDPFAQFDPAAANRLTDTARFLAGMELEANSSLAASAQSGAWVDYRNTFENSWQKLEAQQLAAIRNWASTELSAVNQTNKPIFYPFGGPDFLYAHTFFPNAKDYVLIGLEPVGNLPDLAAFSDSEIAQKLNEMQGAMYSLLQFSFFQTNSMQVELADKGVLPILFIFLARTNNRILSLEYIGLDGDGNVNVYPDGNIDPAYYKGVKIAFTQPGKPAPQYLYYFSLDLSDQGMQASPALTNFANKQLQNPITYTKAASYLMHYDNFSEIRNLVLTRSTAILEDDSGIPVGYFDRNQWNLQFYGTYTQPIALFDDEYQSDLAQIYQTDPAVKPLGFGIGYKYGANESNLMLATKKN